MKYVSPAYQKAINLHRSQGIRNQMHAKINFGIIDQYAFSDASITVSPGVSFSDPSGIQTGVNDVTESYASWEQDFWQLNGSQRFLDTQTSYDTGYISTQISGEDGTFFANPYIDITFSTLHSMVGITLQFDTVTGTCPSDFTVTAYDGSTLKNTWEITGNTDVIYQGELGIENADPYPDRVYEDKAVQQNPCKFSAVWNCLLFSGEDIISITHNRAAVR